MYKVKLTETVSKTLTNFHPDIKKSIKASLNEIAQTPYSGKELQEDLHGFLSYGLKRYRIIYKVDDRRKIITVYMVGRRRDIYELFSEYLKSK